MPASDTRSVQQVVAENRFHAFSTLRDAGIVYRIEDGDLVLSVELREMDKEGQWQSTIGGHSWEGFGLNEVANVFTEALADLVEDEDAQQLSKYYNHLGYDFEVVMAPDKGGWVAKAFDRRPEGIEEEADHLVEFGGDE